MLQNKLYLQNNFGLKPMSHAREATNILRTGSYLLQNNFKMSGLGNFEKKFKLRYGHLRGFLEAKKVILGSIDF